MTSENKAMALEFKQVGNAHFKAQNFEDALKAFDDAIEADPTDHVLYSNRSGTYINLELPELALEDAKKCIELNGAWAKGYSRLGTAYFNLGDIEEAENAFEQGLEIDPNNQALKDGLSSCQRQFAPNMGGMPDMGGMGGMPGMGGMGGMPGMGGMGGAGMGAIGDIFNDPEIMGLLKEDPQLLMKILGKMGEIQSNPSALLNDPDPKVQKILMKLMSKMGGAMGGMGAQDAPVFEEDDTPEPIVTPEPTQNATATSMKEPVKELAEWESLKAQGNEAYKSKDFVSALELYQQAYDASEKKELLILNNMAAVHMEQKNFETAISKVQEALDRRGDVPCSYEVAGKLMARMGVIYDRQGDYANAVHWYEKSLVEENVRKVRGDLSRAKMALSTKLKESYYDDEKAEIARLEGNELFKKGSYPEALKSYDEGIKRNPKDARIYSNRAACYLKLFDPPNALRDVDRAIEVDPKFVRAYSRKGEIHMRMKENHKALEAYQAGLKIEPEDVSCQEGYQACMLQIHSSSQSGDIDEQQRQRAMADPEIQAILADPQFQLMLNNAQENPNTLNAAMTDPKFAKGIEKLIAAGILKVG